MSDTQKSEPLVFIKKGNQYAIPYMDNINLPILSLFQYLIDNNHVIDSSIIETYEKAKSMCTFRDGVYYFYSMEFKLINKPSHETMVKYSVLDVENSYQDILNFDKYYRVIFDSFSQQKKIFNKLKNSDLLNYYPFSAIESSFKNCSWKFLNANLDDPHYYHSAKFLDSTKPYFGNLYLYDLRHVFKLWADIIDEHGKIKMVESASLDIPYFSETVYALYGSHRWGDGNEGYAQNQQNSIGNLANARLYRTIDGAKNQSQVRKPMVVEVKVEFQRIVWKSENANSSFLDAFSIQKEKEQLEHVVNSLNVEQLTEQLCQACGEEDVELKNYLHNYVEKKKQQSKQKKGKI